MGLLSWIILGGIAGAIAKRILPGPKHGGMLLTIALGIGGGVLGGAISSAIFGVPIGSFFDLRTWIICVIGALGMLIAYRVIMDKFGDTLTGTSSDTDTARLSDSDNHK